MGKRRGRIADLPRICVFCSKKFENDRPLPAVLEFIDCLDSHGLQFLARLVEPVGDMDIGFGQVSVLGESCLISFGERFGGILVLPDGRSKRVGLLKVLLLNRCPVGAEEFRLERVDLSLLLCGEVPEGSDSASEDQEHDQASSEEGRPGAFHFMRVTHVVLKSF